MTPSKNKGEILAVNCGNNDKINNMKCMRLLEDVLVTYLSECNQFRTSDWHFQPFFCLFISLFLTYNYFLTFAYVVAGKTICMVVCFMHLFNFTEAGMLLVEGHQQLQCLPADSR